MSAIIQVRGLSKHFREITAVNDLSFDVPAGQVYGFLGQNGAGKSTTIRMLLTLIAPDSGVIEIFGMNLQKHRRDILKKVGAIIEKPDLYKYLTALENLRLFAAISGVKLSEKQMMEQLHLVGLDARANSRVKTFSQGMKQRLGIATALIHDPELIILDEPTNGLDPQGIADVRNLILHLSNDRRKTVFVSSHLLSEIELVADSVLIINNGKKVAEGDKQELLNPVKTQVELVTDDKSASVDLIKQTQWGSYLIDANNNDEDKHILFEMDKILIPQLNRALVERGINVLSLKPKHSLEDLFLSLTGHQ
ncbi:MAG TPA: ABC transporter ATP-binding protein [Chitinophagaceae bacterium]|nr:ABC transporter ATP-binding protein [Chitinophagaceae bacterium]